MTTTATADAEFVQQARELAEHHSGNITDYLAKGHKQVAKLHAKISGPLLEKQLVQALKGCIDSLEYVNRTHPEATGSGVRLQRIRNAEYLIAKVEEARR